MSGAVPGQPRASGRRRRLRWALRWGPAGVIAVAAAIFFSPFFLRGEIFLAADTLYTSSLWSAFAPPGFRAHNSLITDPVNHNWSQLYNEQLKAGGLKSWNPYVLGGLPANGITAMSGMPGRYNPLKLLLHRFLDPPAAMTLLLFASVLLMGLTMYSYLLRVGAGRFGAVFGALAFMFNGTAMVWLEFENLVTAAAFLPLLFLLMERFLGPRRYSAAFLAAGVLGLIALMGHLQYLIYTALLLLAYLAFQLVRLRRSAGGLRAALPVLVCFAITCAGGALIGAIDLAPILDMMPQSSRIARAFTFTGFFETLGRVPLRFYVTQIFPFYFGSPHLGFNVIPSLPTQEYMNYNELCLYLGVPTLFALAGCLAARKSRHAIFFLALTACIAAMMSGTIVYYPFFKLFPGMDRMNPTRLVYLFSFTAAAAAGIGAGRLALLAGRRRLVFGGLVAVLLAGTVALAATAGRPAVAAWFNSETFESMGRSTIFLDQLGRIRSLSAPVILKPLLLAAAAATLVLGRVFLPRPGLRFYAGAALLALLAFDLISFGREYNTRSERRLIYPATPAIAFLQRQPRPFRVVLAHGVAGGNFLHNTLAPFGIEDAGGYSSFYPEGTNALMSFVAAREPMLAGRRFDRWVSAVDLGSPILDIMNVRYVVTAPGARLPERQFRPVYKGEVAIWEKPGALPRAWVVPRAVAVPGRVAALQYLVSPAFDPRAAVVIEGLQDDSPPGAVSDPGTAVVESYGEDDVVITTGMQGAGWLVLADTWYPGWEATVNGKPAPILRANANFRAVRVPAGTSRVVFAFRPASVRLGGRLTLLGLVFAAGGLALARRFERRPGRSCNYAAGGVV